MNTPKSDAYERGRQWGSHFKTKGRDYGMVRGHYPSCPYHTSDPRCAEYAAGYEEGFNGL